MLSQPASFFPSFLSFSLSSFPPFFYILKKYLLFIYLAALGPSCIQDLPSLLQHVKFSFPDQRSNLGPLHWEHGVLATGPGKSLFYIFFKALGGLGILSCWGRIRSQGLSGLDFSTKSLLGAQPAGEIRCNRLSGSLWKWAP